MAVAVRCIGLSGVRCGEANEAAVLVSSVSLADTDACSGDNACQTVKLSVLCLLFDNFKSYDRREYHSRTSQRSSDRTGATPANAGAIHRFAIQITNHSIPACLRRFIPGSHAHGCAACSILPKQQGNLMIWSQNRHRP